MAALAGKVALVTGGTSGIGLATSIKFVELGAKVVITGRDADKGRSAAQMIGAGAVFVQGDMAVAASVQKAIATAVERFGGLDIVVNNAARSQSVVMHEMSDEEFDDVIHSVLYSVFYGSKYAVPAMEARGGGAIVNIGSSAGVRPAPLLGGYAAGKAGVLRLTQCMAQELRDKNIRVNAINPGWIYTPIIETVRAEFDERLGMPLDDFVAQVQGRWGTPEEIADTVVHLASDQARFVSGAIHDVDNGLLARLF